MYCNMNKKETLFVNTKVELDTEELLRKILNYLESYNNKNFKIPKKLGLSRDNYKKILKERPDVIMNGCIMGMKVETF